MPDNHKIATVNRKGLLPKLSGSATEVFLGTGAFGAQPSGGTEFLFTADPDTGFSNPSANTIKVITGNAEAWRVLSTGELRGPDAASSSSNGTARTIRGGPGGSSSGDGGTLTIIGGTPVSGVGGSVSIQGTNGVGTNKAGGYLELLSGAATGTAQGGTFYITGGLGNASTGTGGEVNLTGGIGAVGGPVQLRGGDGSNGNGGVLLLLCGAGTGVGAAGGTVSFTPGAGSGGATNGDIDFYSASAALQFRVNGTTKHTSHMGTAPTITAGGGTGPSPSIAGKDEAFTITVGGGGLATSVEVTFANAFTNAPQCSANHQGAILVLRCVSLTNKVTIDAATPFTASGKIDVICRGYE